MAGRNNLVVFFGLSPSGAGEADELRLLGNHIILVANGKTPDVVSIAARSFDLADPRGRTGFVALLGLGEPRASKLKDALASGGHKIRDELGQLAIVFNRAEQTKRFPGRMAISGEHLPGMYWGTGGNGIMTTDDIKHIAEIFPGAAGAIEDLYISACNSSGDVVEWSTIFPRVKTIWAYLHTAPSLATGGRAHIRLWDRATRGHAARINRGIAKGTGRGENVAVWSRIYGLQTGTIEPIETLRARISNGESTFTSFFNGEQIVVDHQAGPLRQYYDDIQSLLRYDDLPAGERRTMEERAEVTIRVIYFDRIRVVFQRQHGRAITSGYSAIGLGAPPDLGTLDRRAALAEIRRFLAALRPDAPDAAKQLQPLLTEGLRDLSKRLVPANWIE